MALRLSGLQNSMHSVCVGRIRHLCRHPAKRPSFGLLHYLQQRIQQAGKTAIQIFAAQ
jgi:hypothetical protein